MKVIKGNFTLSEYKSKLNQLITLYNRIHDERLPEKRKTRHGFFGVEEVPVPVEQKTAIRINIFFNEFFGHSPETGEVVYTKHIMISQLFPVSPKAPANIKDAVYRDMYEEFVVYSLFAMFHPGLKDMDGSVIPIIPVQQLMMQGIEESKLQDKEVKEQVEK